MYILWIQYYNAFETSLKFNELKNAISYAIDIWHMDNAYCVKELSVYDENGSEPLWTLTKTMPV